MDDFIDPFLQSSPWHDMSASARSYGGDESSPPICMIPSNMENLSAEAVDLYRHDDSSSFFTDATLTYCISKGLFPELNASCSVPLPHNSLSVAGSIESSGTEPSGFTPSLGDPHSVTSVPAMWPSSYSDVSLLGQGEHQGFGFQVAGSDVEIPKKTPLVNGKFSHLDSLPGATLQDQNEIYNSRMANFSDGHQLNLPRYSQPRQQEINELHNFHMPFLAAGSQMISSKVAGIQARQQLSQPAQVNTTKHQTNDSFGNGSVKPRVRARRGQATDPHSIAERLRRVKIAERMKNLQELVPNSNKADKASMLDEIIDYVRFLQLQVKVLSMSRLGAAGAAVHPITDSQAESQDDLAFEQEVVKLMESSVTAAMQYLQNKGLCLMPIAIASAVSAQKGCSDATIKREDALKSIGN